MDKAKALTLPELLGTVPSDARLVLSNEDKREVHIIPVGRHCHSAAAELRRLHAENEALQKALYVAVARTARRCAEMAMWPQGIDDEQAYYGRMFAEFIEREFKGEIARAAIKAVEETK